MNILDTLIHWVNQPENQSQVNGAIGLAIGGAIYILVPRIRRLIDKGGFGNLLIVDDQVIYTINNSTRGRPTGPSYSFTKIVTLSAQSGAVLKARTLHNDLYAIKLIADGKIWTCAIDYGETYFEKAREFRIKVLDRVTLKTVDDLKSIQKLIHLKEKSERLVGMDVNEISAKIYCISNYETQYDINSFKFPFTIPSRKKLHESKSTFDNHTWIDPYSIIFESKPDRYLINFNNKRLRTESFMRPIWVNNFQNESAKGVVFVHVQTPEPFADASLTFLSADGKIIWSVSQKTMGLKRSTMEYSVPGFLYFGAYKNIMIYRADNKRIIAINASSGKIAWTKSL